MGLQIPITISKVIENIQRDDLEPLEIAKAIEYAYLNRDSLKARGRIGRKIIQREYTWDKVAKDLEDYLLSIVEVSRK